MARDPFQKFGGKAVQEPKDPFAQFGGASTEQSRARPAVQTTQDVTEAEIRAISQKHGLSKEQQEQLSDIKSYFGAISGELDPTTAAKETAGLASEVFALGIPQWMYKKFQTDEMEAAIDDMNELIRERKPWYRQATELVGGLGGALKGARAAAKVAQAGSRAARYYEPVTAITSPAAESLAEARRGEELTEAAKGAAIGAAFAGGLGAAAYGGKLIKDLSDSALKKMESQLEEIPGIMNRAESRMAQEAEEIDAKVKMIQRGAIDDYNQFKDVVPPNQINKLLAEADKKILKKPNSPEARAILKLTKAPKKELETALAFNRARTDINKKIGDTYKRLQPTRAAEDFKEMTRREYLVEEAAELKNVLPKWSPLRKVQFVISDARPLAKSIDTKLGTDMTEVLDDISRRGIKYQTELMPYMKTLSQLQRQTRRARIDSVRLYEALDTGNKGDIPDELFRAWKRFFNQAADEANRLGIKIDKRTNYVPYKRYAGLKYLEALDARAKELGEKVGADMKNLKEEEFNKLSKNKRFQELLSELEFIHNTPIDSAQLYNAKFNQSFNNRGQVFNKLRFEATAAREREGQIPEFVKNKDVGALASGWLQSTFKAAQIQPALDRLETVMRVAQKAGDQEVYEYIGNLLQDIQGTRKTIATAARDAMDAFRQGMEIRSDQAKDPVKKGMYQGIAYMPELLSTAGRQVYANYLGLNPKSVLQNLASPYIMNLGELGPAYTTKLYLEATTDLVKLIKSGKKLEPFLAEQGLLPPQWKGELLDGIKESSRRTLAGDAARSTIEKYENLMLGAFNKSEQIARFQNLAMAKRLTKDMTKDPRIAKRALDSLDPAYRRSAKRALEAGDSKALEERIVSYFNSNNMFNYDRANMSAYGRYMGPMFSVFSKWPTTIVGRILQETSDKGLMVGGYRTAQTLLAPYFALAMVDFATQPDNSDLYNRIVGRGGIKDWTPFDSVLSSAEGGIVESPAIQSGKALFEALQRDRDGAFNRWVQDTYNTFGYGSGLLRFLGEDIPIYSGRRKPEGPKMERRLKEIGRMIDELD